MSNRIAVEFVRDILTQNPGVNNFGAIYDAMTRAACTRSFRNLGYSELSMAGISFSLLSFSRLERLIAEVQNGMMSDNANLDNQTQ